MLDSQKEVNLWGSVLLIILLHPLFFFYKRDPWRGTVVFFQNLCIGTVDQSPHFVFRIHTGKLHAWPIIAIVGLAFSLEWPSQGIVFLSIVYKAVVCMSVLQSLICSNGSTIPHPPGKCPWTFWLVKDTSQYLGNLGSPQYCPAIIKSQHLKTHLSLKHFIRYIDYFKEK